MIINSLYNYYETLLSDSDSNVSQPGFSRGKVTHAIVLERNGNLAAILDIRINKGNKLISRDLNVPEQVKKTSGVAANFLCDNCSYVLGLAKNDKGKKDRTGEDFTAFKKLHEQVFAEMHDEGAKAVLNFLKLWEPKQAQNHPQVTPMIDELSKGGNLVFKLEGEEGYIHERSAVKESWEIYRSQQQSDYQGQCLITGKELPIARLHPSIKGVTGAKSSGASLVSFNKDAFKSFGKDQSFNAPVSEKAVFGYTTALNYLLGQENHRFRIGDTTTVFWAEKSSDGAEENLLKALISPENENYALKNSDQYPVVKRDPLTDRLLHDVFARIKAGKPIVQDLTGINPKITFYILGLAPNASRLSVRFWHVDKYGNLLGKIRQHYEDLSLVKNFESEADFIPVRLILKETAPLGDSKRIPPLLGGVLIRSILTGAPYPQGLYNSLISRIRSDQKINYIRASVIKAYLVRSRRFYKKDSEVNISMSLDENNPNLAYKLGRVFALLEKAQESANPGLNATIKNRYFGSASASPGTVFPILLRLAQHHIAKADYGRSIDKRIENVLSGVSDFPAHLSLEEQGLFVLGYYHQRQALYKKNQKKEG